MRSVTDSILIWWLRTGRYQWSDLHRRLFERRYKTTTLPLLNSLQEIQACLKQVEWTMDGPLHLFDCISYPESVWRKKKDDCDGFAVFAAELLHRLNSNCHPVLVTALVRPIKYSHTICAFVGPAGDLCFFDNSFLRSENYQTYDEIVTNISQRAEKIVCWDVRNPDTFEMLEFHRSGEDD